MILRHIRAAQPCSRFLARSRHCAPSSHLLQVPTALVRPSLDPRPSSSRASSQKQNLYWQQRLLQHWNHVDELARQSITGSGILGDITSTTRQRLSAHSRQPLRRSHQSIPGAPACLLILFAKPFQDFSKGDAVAEVSILAWPCPVLSTYTRPDCPRRTFVLTREICHRHLRTNHTRNHLIKPLTPRI